MSRTPRTGGTRRPVRVSAGAARRVSAAGWQARVPRTCCGAEGVNSSDDDHADTTCVSSCTKPKYMTPSLGNRSDLWDRGYGRVYDRIRVYVRGAGPYRTLSGLVAELRRNARRRALHHWRKRLHEPQCTPHLQRRRVVGAILPNSRLD